MSTCISKIMYVCDDVFCLQKSLEILSFPPSQTVFFFSLSSAENNILILYQTYYTVQLFRKTLKKTKVYVKVTIPFSSLNEGVT